MTADRAQRRDAIVRTDEGVVLRASAGTGKTTVLVERLACLLLRDEVAPERIVAITFTEMAAAEMKTRLRRRLQEAWRWSQGDDPKRPLDETIQAVGREALAARAHAALDRLDAAAIETIHAFAARLLRRFPEEAGVDASYVVEDETGVREMVDRDWAIWSREEFAKGAKNEGRWRPVLRAIPWAKIEELAVALADFEDLPDDPGALPPEGRAWHEEVLARAERLVAAAEAKVRRDPKVLQQARHAILTLRAAAKGGWRPLDREDEVFGEKLADSYASTGWTDAEYDSVEAAWSAAKAWAATRSEAVEAVRLLSDFARFHQDRAVAAGRLSFNALLALARNLVRRAPRVARRFQQDGVRFLVDEFQDTDARQAEIVFRLASPPPAEPVADWTTLRPRPGALFVVGDAKQSIYAWRGADLGVYDAVCARLAAAGALPRSLSANFRSQPAVIAAANRIFGGAFVEEPGIQAGPADLEASREEKALTGRVLARLSAPTEEKDKAPVQAAREARAIANWIAESRGKLRIEVEEGDARLAKPMRYRDVAILLRQTTHLPEYLRALREARIPYVVTREQHFYEAAEVRDAINLLLALVRPEDALALTGVLRSPVGGLTFDEIHALGRPDFRKNAPGRAGDFFAKLRDLRSRALRLPVPEAVDLVLEESGLRAAAAASGHGEQALANLEKISSLAARWAGPDLTLASFADRLGRRALDVEREAESPLGEPEDDVVRVSTVHAAKGLEWPVVVLAGLHAGQQDGRSSGPILRDGAGFAARLGEAATPAWAWLDDRRRRRADAENLRLFYVACTRAREALILSRAGTKTGPWLDLVPEGLFEDRTGDPGKPKAGPAPSPVAFPAAEEVERWRARREEYEQAMKLPALDSPTGLMHREQDRDDDERFAHSWESPAARAVGVLVHATLERWSFAPAELEPTLLACAASLDPADRAAALPRARELLAAFAASADCREVAQANILGREVPFAMPLTDGRAIVGAMDIVFEKDGKLHVRDWKTGGENKRYETQQGVYVAAMRKLFPGREIVFRFVYLGEMPNGKG